MRDFSAGAMGPQSAAALVTFRRPPTFSLGQGEDKVRMGT